MVRRTLWIAATMTAVLLPAGMAAAGQGRGTVLTDRDRSEIQELVAGYARALGGCDADAFADLFVPDTGYFASNIRGEVVGRERLIALVRSERHCVPPAPGAGAPSASRPAQPARPNAVPTVVIESTASGVTGRADLGNAGSYSDEYARTGSGWRFQSRTVISRQEQAANLTARDFHAIQQLAGSHVGLFEDVYAPGADGVSRFRTSGVALGLSPDGVTGRALLKGDGGHYEDVYVRTVGGGWRFQSRTYVPAGTASAAAPTRTGR